jgi:2-phosphosulfolactate phosphatase
MNIQILQLTEGARQARGLTVVIDVFRAFSVEAYFLSRGAKKIIPIGDAAQAYALKETMPDAILAGERHGKILPGFDCGNSPSQLLELDAQGKAVIHTTSAGTQGIANALYADEILGCSLVTAKATADYIRAKNPETVSLVCMGLEALAPADEDTLCARYLQSLLEGTELDLAGEMEQLRYTTGAKFFDPALQDVFPEQDFHLCTMPNRFDFVLKLHKSQNGPDYIAPVSVQEKL